MAGQSQHGRLGLNDLAGPFGHRIPGIGQFAQWRGHTSLFTKTPLQAVDRGFDRGPGVLEFVEGRRIAGNGLAALDGQALGQHLQVGSAVLAAGQTAALPGGHTGIGTEDQHRQQQQAKPEVGAQVTELARSGGVRRVTHQVRPQVSDF